MTYFVRYTYITDSYRLETSTVITTDRYLVDMDDIEDLIYSHTGDKVQEVLAFSQINIGHQN